MANKEWNFEVTPFSDMEEVTLVTANLDFEPPFSYEPDDDMMSVLEARFDREVRGEELR